MTADIPTELPGNRWGFLLPAIMVLPPAVVLAGVAAVSAWAASVPGENDFYRRKASQAIQRGDGRSQAFALECLLALDPANRAMRWELAQVYRNNGQSGLYDEFAADLAPPDKPGYAPAQMDAAKTLLDKLERQTVAEPAAQNQALELAMAHLRMALVDQPRHVDATERLADILSALGRDTEALEFITKLPINGLPPSLEVRRAWLQEKLSMGKTASRELESVSEIAAKLEGLANKANAPGHIIRAHALSCEMRGKLSAALDIWLIYIRPNSPEFRRLEAQSRVVGLHIRRADEAFNKFPREWEAYADSIDRGLSLDPTSPALLERLVTLANPAGIRSENPENQQLRDRGLAHVNDMLARGVSPALLHMLLAGEYHRKSRQDMARVHFELSFRADPKMPIVANNLAWYLVSTTPRDPERALALVNVALAANVNPGFVETRGQIRAIIGDNAGAIVDLETAGKTLGMSRAIHQTLAKCYEKQGDVELAKKHLEMIPRAKR